MKVMTRTGRNKTIVQRSAAAALSLLLASGALFPASAEQGQIPSFPEQDLQEAKQYAACMELTKAHPQEAYDSAGAWLAKNGGPPAQHCQAVALVGLGRYTEAAQMLQTVAGGLAKTDKSRMLAAQLYDQAGQAWLLDGDAAQAVTASNAALEIAPNDVEMVIDRAMALGAAERWQDAIGDLNHANRLAPKRADILVLRASAYRYTNGTNLALADVNQALTLDPKNAEGYLERGILKSAAGDKNGARTDWVQAAQLAPNTPTAEAAQGRIEKLDLKAQ